MSGRHGERGPVIGTGGVRVLPMGERALLAEVGSLADVLVLREALVRARSAAWESWCPLPARCWRRLIPRA